MILDLLAQMDPSLLDASTPRSTLTSSYGMTWVILAVILVAVLLVTFKTSKRNHLDRE